MTISIQCPSCKHYTGVMTCKAFPERIPIAIMQGYHDHRKPYPGGKFKPADNGIRFEPLKATNDRT